eukprot:CAMPEP_0182820798 /NCGR_PEP_ID=MMETSP0006_2-20121128/13320_1 /TAXON_ID=97485 /ORGANISM="Prymnesium parvum, Strain Texoma1" /LENGTH=309 /DNA_ID=CAMNT_0024947495 /DNA_START=158 /DNA_END=1085 /DNA_ORIENTATION=+
MAPTANANITSSGLTYSAQVDSNLAEHPLILDSSSRRTVGCSYAILTEASLSSDHAQWPASHGYPTLTRGKGISEALTLSTAAVDLLAFSSMNCFVFFLNAAAWQRVLDELIVSKLLEGGPFTTWVAFLSRLERLEWINSNNLVLLQATSTPERASTPQLNARLDTKIYMRQAEGFEERDENGNLEGAAAIVFIAGSPLTWRMGKLRATTLSSTEAEWFAQTTGATILQAFDETLTFLDLEPQKPVLSFCDNKSAVLIAESDLSTKRMKHVLTKMAYQQHSTASEPSWCNLIRLLLTVPVPPPLKRVLP